MSFPFTSCRFPVDNLLGVLVAILPVALLVVVPEGGWVALEVVQFEECHCLLFGWPNELSCSSWLGTVCFSGTG